MLYFANEDYELKCCDSMSQEVDLSQLSDLCFTVLSTDKVLVKNKKAILNIGINVTAATGNLTTSLIDGSSVKFVSATTALPLGKDIAGTTDKNKTNNNSFCLADPDITPLTIKAYTGKGSVGKLYVTGQQTSSPYSTVTETCDVWISSAGQKKVRGN